MADIASTDVTVTIQRRGRRAPKQRENRVAIAFGDAALTYPAGGVPLPAASAFGLQRDFHLELIERDADNNVDWDYDATNDKLRGWLRTTGAELTGAIAAQALVANAVGW